MDHRLLKMAGELAQTAVNIYHSRPVFSHLTPGGLISTRRVYQELIIGVKHNVSLELLAENVAKIAVSSYQNTVYYKLPTATIHETKIVLSRWITQTNTQKFKNNK